MVLICDWSSIAFDYLILDKPTLFLDVEPPFRNGFTLGREYRFGRVVGDMASLCGALRAVLEDQESYLRDHRALHARTKAEVYGGNTDGLVSKRQLERLVDLTTRNSK